MTRGRTSGKRERGKGKRKRRRNSWRASGQEEREGEKGKVTLEKVERQVREGRGQSEKVTGSRESGKGERGALVACGWVLPEGWWPLGGSNQGVGEGGNPSLLGFR